MATRATIPRVLLPQITWRVPVLHQRQIFQPLAAPKRAPAHEPIRHAYQQRRAATSVTRPRQLQNRKLAAACASEAQLTQSIYQALRSSATQVPLSPYETRRRFHFTTSRPREYHFDTLKFSQRLKDLGLSDEQAAGMLHVMSDVVDESIQNLSRTLVLLEDAERATYAQKVDLTKMRSELSNTDSAESDLSRKDLERARNEIAKIQSQWRDEIGRAQASLKLDFNLEKGRVREETNMIELKIKEAAARMDREIATIRERTEQVKLSSVQWVFGVLTGATALILAAWRLLL